MEAIARNRGKGGKPEIGGKRKMRVTRKRWEAWKVGLEKIRDERKRGEGGKNGKCSKGGNRESSKG